MRVRVLGCGGSTGVPTLGGPDHRGDWGACDPAEPRNRRTRASIVIEGAAGRLLVDTGPDLREQFLANAIGAIDAILFTHAHADHIAGLDDVRLLNRVAEKQLPGFATEATWEELHRRFDYAFRPWKPPVFYRPVIAPHLVITGDRILAAGMPVTVFEQDHHVMPSLGLRSAGFAYSTDVVRLDDAALAALHGVDTWLVGCFQRTPHSTHAHLDLVLDWRRRLGIRRTILTHMGTDLDWSWLTRHLPADVEPAFDGMVIDIAI